MKLIPFRCKDSFRSIRESVIMKFVVYAIIVFSSLPALVQAEEDRKTSQPNIVIMLADDLGWADVGYHSDRVETPNIDKLCKEGIELNRFYVAPMCSPTRAGLLTGRYPIRFGLARAVIPPQRDFGLPPEETTIAEALADIGYKHRGVFGKWHLGHHQPKWHPLSQGFTHFEGHYNGAIDYFSLEREGERDWHMNDQPSAKQGYSTDLIADAASKFISEKSKEKAPYFCYVPFNAPHSPFQARDVDLARYTKLRGNKVPKEVILKAMIWRLDLGVGRILDAIEESGKAENTQVWFLSDNGGISRIKANNLPLRGDKLTTYEGGIRVPACVRWPAAWQAGKKLEELMGYVDVFPTILNSAGVDISNLKSLNGRNLNLLFTQVNNSFPDRDWYSYHGQKGPQEETIAVTTPDWKLIINGQDLRVDGVTNEHEVFLFDIQNDPYEKKNLAAEYPKDVSILTEKLIAHRKLQPEKSVPPYKVGKKGFVPPKDWKNGFVKPQWKKHVVVTSRMAINSAVANDFDGDGNIDILSSYEKQVFLLKGPDWKPYKIHQINNRDSKNKPRPGCIHSCLMDVEGDGDLDFCGSNRTVFWLECPDKKSVTSKWKYRTIDDEILGTHCLITGDVNKDGKPDLIANSFQNEGTKFPNSLVWLEVPKNPRQAKRWSRHVFANQDAPGGSHYFGFGDVNNDGFPDISCAAKGGEKFAGGEWFAWWEQPKSGKGAWKKHLLATGEPGATNIHPVDVNKDGHMDFIATRGHGRGVLWFKGPDFKLIDIDPEIKFPHSLVTVDLDKDGDIDFATCGKEASGKCVWYENNGLGDFTRHEIGSNQGAYDIRAVDMDGDKDLDLLIAGHTSKNIVWFENLGK